MILSVCRRVFVSLGFIFFIGLFAAQDVTQADEQNRKTGLGRVPGRPKVGLVLSGGGARGVAHIGVLKVLEELRIPVDMVLGTSMGALIGAIYASGMTPDELEARVDAIRWDDIFNDYPPRQNIPWRQKADDYTNLYALEMGYRDNRILLRYGTTSGYKFEFLLTEMVGLAAGRKDRSFDDLPIPYRAVAMDLEDGSMKVFERGSLVKAMRASMSVPAFIAPAEIDGRLYVDGGMVRNLPVDVARKAGCEIIIAVNLGTPPLRRDQLTSVAAVALQSINLMTEHNVKASLAELTGKDILIEPKLVNIGSADFNRAKETIPIGMESARAMKEQLKGLSVSESDYRTWQQCRAERMSGRIKITDIRLKENLKRVNPDVIVSEIERKPSAIESAVRKKAADIRSAKEDISLEENDLKNLHSNLSTVYGRGDFERLDYSLLDHEGRATVLVEGVEKRWGPNYLKFGFGFASDFSTTPRFNVAAMYRKTWINSLGAEWRTDAQLGYTNRIFTEFYEPLAIRVGAFVVPYLNLQKEPVHFYQGGNRIGQYNVTTLRGGLDAGIQGRIGEFRLGFFQGYLRTSDDFGILKVPNFNLRQGGWEGRFVIDQLDNANFPREGLAIKGRFFVTNEAFGAEDNYNKYELVLRKPFSIDRHTLTVGFSYGDSPGHSLPVYDPFKQGGFLRFSGYNFDQLTGDRYVFGNLVYMYRMSNLPSPLGRGLYLGGALETGRVSNRFDPTVAQGVLYCGNVFFGADTILGPFYMGFGIADDKTSSFYVILGRPYSANW